MSATLTRRDRMMRTLSFQEVDRIPRQLWALPGISHDRPADLVAFRNRFPTDDIMGGPSVLGKSDRKKGEYSRIGKWTDDWGCEWEVYEEGIIGEIKHPILAEDAKVRTFTPPWEMIERADMAPINQLKRDNPDEFIIAGGVGIFERMQFLRGTEQLFVDLAMKDKVAYDLRDMIHAYNLAAVHLIAKSDADAVSIFDDWGTQRSLLISPTMWREFFKPCYKEYCDIFHANGKKVFFHSDGFIEAIYPDLIEIGVNALNSQLFCMDMEKLGRLYSGKIVFWGEIDRQSLMPFGTPDQVRAGVRRAAKALMPSGMRTGVIAQCEWGTKDPLENVVAVFDEWDKI